MGPWTNVTTLLLNSASSIAFFAVAVITNAVNFSLNCGSLGLCLTCH